MFGASSHDFCRSSSSRKLSPSHSAAAEVSADSTRRNSASARRTAPAARFAASCDSSQTSWALAVDEIFAQWTSATWSAAAAAAEKPSPRSAEKWRAALAGSVSMP